MIKGLKKIEFISPKIIHLIFDTQYNLSDVFVRFSEYYESPKYRGKDFTRKEFFRWFKKTYKKDYHKAWAGFNIPSYVLKADMFQWECNTLSTKWGIWEATKSEKAFVRFFKDFKGKFYIIGSSEDEKDVKKHELCHALFYLNSSYKKEVLSILSNFKTDALKTYLKFTGYCDEVHLDEINAYVTCKEWDCLDDIEGFEKYSKEYKELSVKLNKLFDKYRKDFC